MRRLHCHARRIYEAAVLLAAGYASLATSAPADQRVDNRWVIANLFDGQTAVPRDVTIELRIGIRDFRPADGGGSTSAAREEAEAALHWLWLHEADGVDEVALEHELRENVVLVHPVEPLQPDTRYALDVVGVAANTASERPIPEVIEFTTRSGPQVTGLWRVSDTLMITFSEPIAPGTLRLAPDSVDLLWDSEDGLRSVTADRNLADYVWDDDGLTFRVAPFDFSHPVWVMVSADVRGVSGAPLDGDGDGVPGEPDDDFLEQVNPSQLPGCFTSEDRPEPCLPQTAEW